MANLKEVRLRIASVKSTQQITRAMKVVAAAKLRKAQQRIVQMRPYADKLQYMLGQLAGSLEGSELMKYYEQRPIKKALVVVVTSDRGLAGSFNSALVKEAVRHLNGSYAHLLPTGQVDLMTIGKKGRDYFKKTKFNIAEENITIFHNLTYEASESIAQRLMTQFTEGQYDAIDVVYNQFKNAAVFIPTVQRFLPIPVTAQAADTSYQVDYIFEPNREAILGALIVQSLRINFFRSLLDSNAAEFGARMTAMDKATDNAEELLKALKLQYNKERQAAITKELTEIVGGAQALAG